jgi:hypothetical protein
MNLSGIDLRRAAAVFAIAALGFAAGCDTRWWSWRHRCRGVDGELPAGSCAPMGSAASCASRPTARHRRHLPGAAPDAAATR